MFSLAVFFLLISHFLKFDEYDRNIFQYLLTTTEVVILLEVIILLEAAVITPGVEDTARAVIIIRIIHVRFLPILVIENLFIDIMTIAL